MEGYFQIDVFQSELDQQTSLWAKLNRFFIFLSLKMINIGRQNKINLKQSDLLTVFTIKYDKLKLPQYLVPPGFNIEICITSLRIWFRYSQIVRIQKNYLLFPIKKALSLMKSSQYFKITVAFLIVIYGADYSQFYNSMFKKKAKKEGGVVNFQEHEQAQKQKDPQEGSKLKIDHTVSQAAEKSQVNSNINRSLGSETIQFQQLNAKISSGADHEAKRGKNFQQFYTQDAKQQLDNEPKKRIKDTPVGTKQKYLISNNTYQRNQQIGQAVHESFQDINYKAGKNLIKDLELPADQLEEQLAKKRFLDNVQTTRLIKEGKLNTKIYRGMNNYANHKLTNDDIQNAQQSYKKKMGPSRLNSTIKNGCRFDYVLNLCKDWHDSGYCPFGNSCLYLHDRSNHKTGWELEKDFQLAEKERWRRINNPQLAKKQDRQKLLKTIEKYKPQQICSFCNKSLENPVQMECGHIFCTSCALKIVKCKECGKRLSGIMNEAKSKLEKQRKDYEDMVDRLEAGEEEVQAQRRKFQNTDSIDVFAD